MKKHPFSILLVATLLFLGFMLGFLIGRGYAQAPVLVSIPKAMPNQPVFQKTVHEPHTFPIDLNHADKDALMNLPGIGENLALRILAYRRERGSFHSIDDLFLVEGITEEIMDKLQNLVTVGG